MKRQPRKPRQVRRAILAAAVLGAAATPVFAQDATSQFISPYDQTLTIGLGGIVNRFDTSLRLDGNTHSGTDFTLENNGLKKDNSSFEALVTWRIARAHRLDFEYWTAKRSGSRDYSTSIDIGDTTFPIGANVSIQAKDSLASLDYRWSFSQSPDSEWAAVIGFYGGKFTFDVNAVGNAGTVNTTYNKSVSTTLPLPLLGVSWDWYPDKQWQVSAVLQGMKAKVGDVDGHCYQFWGGLEYQLWRNFGVGARYTYNDLGATVSKSDFNGNLSWKSNAVSLYGKFVF